MSFNREDFMLAKDIAKRYAPVADSALSLGTTLTDMSNAKTGEDLAKVMIKNAAPHVMNYVKRKFTPKDPRPSNIHVNNPQEVIKAKNAINYMGIDDRSIDEHILRQKLTHSIVKHIAENYDDIFQDYQKQNILEP